MSDSINPNTPVMNGSSTLDVPGGSGPVTFDELDALTSDPKPKTEAKKSEKTETKTSKDLTSDDQKGKKEVSKPKADGKEKTSDKVESEADETTELPPKKTFRARNGDDDLDLFEDALVPVTVNGKEEKVTLKDLRENYSGKIAYDKKFSEVNNMKKQANLMQAKLDQSAAKIKDIFSEKDPDKRMYRMAALAGVNPVEYKKNFLETNVALLEKFQSMSDDEKKLFFTEEENKFLKYERETQKSTDSQKQSRAELHSRVEKLRATHQVSEDEFADRYEAVSQIAKNDPSIKVTPEFIVETIQKDRLWNAAEAKIKELNLNWDSEKTSKSLLALTENSFMNKLTPTEVAEIVNDLWGAGQSSKTNDLAKQKAEQKREFTTGKKPVQGSKASNDEPMFWDDL